MIALGKIREWAYRRKLLKPADLPAFTVSVGNISLGGTGKSAFVMWLAEWAVARRVSTAVLSRGYKRKSKRVVILGAGGQVPDASEIGDEPWMIKSRVPQVSLLVHADRARMAKRHWSELGSPRLVILDDAFQHWRSARDLDVLMIDATESLEQKTLPFGRLRETVIAARRADLVIVSRASAVARETLEKIEAKLRQASTPRHQPTWKRHTLPKLLFAAADYQFTGLLNASTGEPVKADGNREYLLVSGIAKPDHLRFVVKQAGLQVVEELYFPDHHRLDDSDVRQIKRAVKNLRNGALLVTEKDWGRWRELFEEVEGFVVRVRFEFQEGELEEFLREVSKGVGCSTLP